MKIKIVSKHATYGTTVEIDGCKMSGVKGISFSHAVGELPSLTLVLVPVNGYEVEGGADLRETTSLTQDHPVRTFVPQLDDTVPDMIKKAG